MLDALPIVIKTTIIILIRDKSEISGQNLSEHRHSAQGKSHNDIDDLHHVRLLRVYNVELLHSNQPQRVDHIQDKGHGDADRQYDSDMVQV
jgi:hypothetical protein